MKTKVKELLGLLQSSIEGRLSRENGRSRDDGRPVLRGMGADYEIASRVRAVAAGGVALVQRMVQVLGLDREIDERLDLLAGHRPYHESDHVTNIAYSFIAGGTCLQDLELLRRDEQYMDMIGARRIPGPSTAGDFCRRFESAEHVDALQAAIDESRIRVWAAQPNEFLEHAQIDVDGTIIEASETSAGADFSYKKTFGYQPLVITLANTQEVLSIENRAASRPSNEGAAARLDRAVQLVIRAGFRRVTLRGDTDFSQTMFLDGWDNRGVQFVFGYKAYGNLVGEAESLAETDWRLLEREGYEIKTVPRSRPENARDRAVEENEYLNIHLLQEHVAEFDYRPAKCSRAYRMVVVRKHLAHERGQRLLFTDYRYFFYITNKRDEPAREIVRAANSRCGQERVFGVLKSETAALRAPLDNTHSNWAYMVIATLAWNLTKWVALLIPEEEREDQPDEEDLVATKQAVLRMNFDTFTAAFIRIPAQLVRGARGLTLRLLSWNRWQLTFFRVHGAINAMA